MHPLRPRIQLEFDRQYPEALQNGQKLTVELANLNLNCAQFAKSNLNSAWSLGPITILSQRVRVTVQIVQMGTNTASRCLKFVWRGLTLREEKGFTAGSTGQPSKDDPLLVSILPLLKSLKPLQYLVKPLMSSFRCLHERSNAWPGPPSLSTPQTCVISRAPTSVFKAFENREKGRVNHFEL
jgi:hypothetical protein